MKNKAKKIKCPVCGKRALNLLGECANCDRPTKNNIENTAPTWGEKMEGAK